MEIVILYGILVLPMFVLLIRTLAKDMRHIQHGASGQEYIAVKQVNGDRGVTVGSPGEAKALIAKSINMEGEVGACKYLDGTDVRTMVGICHETDDGGKRIEFLP